jgi:hypothetical protein
VVQVWNQQSGSWFNGASLPKYMMKDGLVAVVYCKEKHHNHTLTNDEKTVC